MRRAVLVAMLAAGLWSPFAPAQADDTVVVPGLAFPSTDTYLTYFGCDSLFQGSTEPPQVRIGQGDNSPEGARSFGLLVPGTGTASGPVRRVESIADTTVAGFSARSDTGASGAAYVWYVTPGLREGRVWAGRAELSVGSAWQYVDTAAATYSWQLVDAATGDLVRDGGRSGIADFTATNGDGPGYLLAGLGCGGEEFSIDALRFGSPGSVTTYDLEGIRVTTSITASAQEVPAGTEVTLVGSSVDATGVPVGAPMVLEAQPAGSGEFRPTGKAITASEDGLVRAVVTPDETTTYRWLLPGLPYADASWSAPVTVVVTETTDVQPSDQPSDQPSTQPSAPPTDQPEDEPTPTLSPPPTGQASESPTDGPTDTPTDTPSESPTESPTDSPSETPTP